MLRPKIEIPLRSEEDEIKVDKRGWNGREEKMEDNENIRNNKLFDNNAVKIVKSNSSII